MHNKIATPGGLAILGLKTEQTHQLVMHHGQGDSWRVICHWQMYLHCGALLCYCAIYTGLRAGFS